MSRRAIPSAPSRRVAAGHAGSRRRGLTLIEILIAIGLVLAIAALALPSLSGMLGERTFEGAADVIGEQLRLARAEAQATGHPIEVTYEPRTRVVSARRFRIPDPGADEAPLFDDELPLVDLVEADDDAIAGGWAYRPLPRGLRLTRRPPEPDDPEAPGLDAVDPDLGFDPEADLPLFDDDPALDDDAAGKRLRVAVFLPDGSALVGQVLWLSDDEGRRGRISVNPWTGLPAFDRGGGSPPVEPEEDADLDALAEDDLDEPDDEDDPEARP